MIPFLFFALVNIVDSWRNREDNVILVFLLFFIKFYLSHRFREEEYLFSACNRCYIL